MGFTQIGAYQFVSKAGEDPVPPAQTVKDITREGVDSEAFQRLGKRAPKVQWTTEVDTNTPSTTFAAYEAMQGSLQTVIVDDGNSFLNVMVHSVHRVRVKKITNAVGGVTPGGGWLLVAQWVLQGT